MSVLNLMLFWEFVGAMPASTNTTENHQRRFKFSINPTIVYENIPQVIDWIILNTNIDTNYLHLKTGERFHFGSLKDTRFDHIIHLKSGWVVEWGKSLIRREPSELQTHDSAEAEDSDAAEHVQERPTDCSSGATPGNRNILNRDGRKMMLGEKVQDRMHIKMEIHRFV